MGKPGGFFKKLKAKKKRAETKQQRGTKGASPEERRRKRAEQSQVFAAKKEAEDLAAVSSSSESEASTDSDKEAAVRDRKLNKLRRMLGVHGRGTGGDRTLRSHAIKNINNKRQRGSDSENDGGGDNDDGDSISDSTDGETEEDRQRRPPQSQAQKKKMQLRRRHESRNGNDADDEEEEEEGQEADDWETFIGAAGDGDDDDDEEDEEGGDEEDDDSDRLDDHELLIDNISEDEEDDDDDEEGSDGDDDAAANPFFRLLNDGSDDDGEDEADFIIPEEFQDVEDDDDDDDEKEEEGDEEDEYQDEDDVSDDDSDDDTTTTTTTGSNKKKGATTENKRKAEPAQAETRALLPQFALGTTSLATLQSSGLIADPSDPWYLKYHVDARKEVDRTPLEPVAVSPAAVEGLRTANAPLQCRAKQRELEEGGPTSIRKDVQFVSAEDYNAIHPENVSVTATEAARAYLTRRPPFNAAAVGGGGGESSKDTTSTAAAAAFSTDKPPYMHDALWAKWVAYRSASNPSTAAYYRNTAGVVLTTEERGFLDILQGYADLMDCTRCWQAAESRREIFALHLLNHWFKTRAVVLAHDKMLAAHKERRRRRKMLRKQKQQKTKAGDIAAVAADADDGNSDNAKPTKKKTRRVEISDDHNNHEDEEEEDDDDDLELRDRGFGKTRLFLMLPMRNQAYEYVNTIVHILGADPADCPKLATFEQDFTEIEEGMDPTFKRRPREYRRQFAGNIDDSFCVGLRLEPHRVHLYTHPLNSDLIICSPLGLRRRLERSGDVLVSLASIEVCVIDDAQVLLEQNWQQVTAVMDLLNKKPTDTTHGLSDLRRVYAWALTGTSGRHRQTVISSDLSNATILSTFRSCVNTFGKVVLQHKSEEGVLSKVQVPVRQHFIRFPADSLATVDDDRFEYFTKNIYATKINPVAERDVRTIIVVPSYFDFVRLRNYMFREYREAFTAISEYTSVKQQRRALGQFTDLERPVLIVTERFYFFKRYFVKFAEVIVFYSPPIFPTFYAALVNRLVATSPNAFAMTVFCRYDTHELNRIAGTTRMMHMLQRESGIFSFVTS